MTLLIVVGLIVCPFYNVFVDWMKLISHVVTLFYLVIVFEGTIYILDAGI